MYGATALYAVTIAFPAATISAGNIVCNAAVMPLLADPAAAPIAPKPLKIYGAATSNTGISAPRSLDSRPRVVKDIFPLESKFT